MKSKNSKQKIRFVILLIADVALIGFALSQLVFPHWIHSAGVFSPAGTIAAQQKQLILSAIGIMLIPVIPILSIGFYFAYKYRAGNDEEYKPEGLNPRLQIVGWLFLILIITGISVLNYRSAHYLDPAKPISSNNQPLIIQVMALQWKWLFIYPKQNIATVNYIDIPVNVPVHFELSADGPMNLFWIPQLGGQMGAMAGMVNPLNLMATQTGQFRGTESEINGDGYSHMNFTVNSVTPDEFNNWVSQTKKTANPLSQDTYNRLAEPSYNTQQTSYSSVSSGLYQYNVMKYMTPATSPTSTGTASSTMPGINNTSMPGMHM